MDTKQTSEWAAAKLAALVARLVELVRLGVKL